MGLTKTKNWSGRNGITETCGRLHPLWPQNKRLHTPRTTDYSHTRQDRWIQTELAFTLTKNATKPSSFEIIPLQTTRKENNWKTEEALARATVTVETERIKGANSCCWWWWWWPPNLLGEGLVIHPEDTLPNSESPEEAQDWCIGARSCNSGDGTDQSVQSLMLMMNSEVCHPRCVFKLYIYGCVFDWIYLTL